MAWRKPKTAIQLGISEDSEHYCLVYFDGKIPQCYWHKKPCELKQAVNFSQKIRIIRPLKHHYLWRKYLFLPQRIQPKLVYRQVISLLRKELPISLDEIYFDYQTTLLKNDTYRLILYAVKKTYADPLILDKKTVLDCELHCYLRAAQYLLKPHFDQDKIYKINHYYFQYQLDKLLIQSQIDENEESIDLNELAFEQEMIKPDLYLQALGASLWRYPASI